MSAPMFFPRLIWNYQYLKELKTRFSCIYFPFVYSLFPSAALQKDFFTKYGQIRSFLTFTEENYNGKLNFLCLVTLTEETRNRKFHFYEMQVCTLMWVFAYFLFLSLGKRKHTILLLMFLKVLTNVFLLCFPVQSFRQFTVSQWPRR